MTAFALIRSAVHGTYSAAVSIRDTAGTAKILEEPAGLAVLRISRRIVNVYVWICHDDSFNGHMTRLANYAFPPLGLAPPQHAERTRRLLRRATTAALVPNSVPHREHSPAIPLDTRAASGAARITCSRNIGANRDGPLIPVHSLHRPPPVRPVERRVSHSVFALFRRSRFRGSADLRKILCIEIDVQEDRHIPQDTDALSDCRALQRAGDRDR